MNTPYAEAFTEQLRLLREQVDGGMPRLGWKVGINVPEVQRQLGLTHSLIGWLDGRRRFTSGAVVPIPQDGKIHVEPEVCVRISRPVISLSDREAAFSAVDAMAPALELVDYARPAGSVGDVVCGSMFHSATVVGSWQVPCRNLAIADQVSLQVGSLQSEPARADLVPPDVADLVLFVATLLEEVGERLSPGDHILSGAFTAKALPLRVGQTAEARLGPLGTVRCTAAA